LGSFVERNFAGLRVVEEKKEKKGGKKGKK